MDCWQSLSNRLADHQQRVSASLFKLSTHEENVTKFTLWLQDAERKMKHDSELQPTLQAKKAVLHNIKVIRLLLIAAFSGCLALIVSYKLTLSRLFTHL